MTTGDRRTSAAGLAVSIAAGAVMGIFLAAGNVYAGLKIGFTSDGSLVAAILAVAAIRLVGIVLPVRLGEQHTNITQTAASAGAFSAVAGLTNAVPAMRMDGVVPDPWLLLPWVFFVAALGICIAVPLRRRAIEVEKLRFPSGTVAAETIKTLHARSWDAVRGLVVLVFSSGLASVITFLRDVGVPGISPPIIPGKTTVPGSIGAFSCEDLSLGIAWSPMLVGVGAIVGLRTALSLVLGAMLAWPLGGPLLAEQGLIDPEARRAIVGWTVWPAVGLITAGGLASLLLGGRLIARALSFLRRRDGDLDEGRGARTEGRVPAVWWLVGLAVSAAGATASAWLAFGVPWWQSLVAIVLALPIAAVAVRAVGETDISPSNNLAKATQFVFAGLAPGQTVANVAAAGVASGCAMEASEVMTDLKAGHMLGNRPRDQFVAQVIGILCAAGSAVAAYSLLVAVLPVGDESGLPAPTAVAWRTLADGLAGGRGGIPLGAALSAWIAAGAGIVLAVVAAIWKKIPFPSPVAMGLGAILPPAFSITIALGAGLGALAGWLAEDLWQKDRYMITSGLIVGESLTGLLAAGLVLIGWA